MEAFYSSENATDIWSHGDLQWNAISFLPNSTLDPDLSAAQILVSVYLLPPLCI